MRASRMMQRAPRWRAPSSVLPPPGSPSQRPRALERANWQNKDNRESEVISVARIDPREGGGKCGGGVAGDHRPPISLRSIGLRAELAEQSQRGKHGDFKGRAIAPALGPHAPRAQRSIWQNEPRKPNDFNDGSVLAPSA